MNKHGIILVLALVLAISICACILVVFATPLNIARADSGVPLYVSTYYYNFFSAGTYTDTLVQSQYWTFYGANCVAYYDDSVYEPCDWNGNVGYTENFQARILTRGDHTKFAYTFFFKRVLGSGDLYVAFELNHYGWRGSGDYFGWYVCEGSTAFINGSYSRSALSDHDFEIVFSTVPSSLASDSFLQASLISFTPSLVFDTYYYTHFGGFNWTLDVYTHAEGYHVSTYVLQNVPADTFTCTLTYHAVSPADNTTPFDLVSTLPFDENETIILSAPSYVSSITISYPGSQTSYTISDDPDDDEDWIDLAHENFTYLAYEEPYGIAYYNGYNDGIRLARENNLINMTFAALQMPFKLLFGTWDADEETYVDGLFTIEILGVDLRAFVLGILSAVIIIRLLRLIIGVAGSTGGGA